MTSARQLAFDLIWAVEQHDAYANLELPKLLEKSGLDKRDRGFSQELGYGTIRWQMQYSEITKLLAGDRAIDPDIAIWLKLGMHQLFRMRVPVHAAIGETVEHAKRNNQKAAGFLNALLRRASERSLDDWIQKLISGKSELEKLALQYSHPKWIVSLLKEALELDGKAEQLPKLLQSHQDSPRPQLIALPPHPIPEGAESTDLSKYGFRLDGFELAPGYRYQDQGSQYVTEIAAASAKPGRWLDMCAGPGGKAALLAALALTKDTEVNALEIHSHRANLVRHALKEYPNANVTVADATTYETEHRYDLVLVDAPCSGLGALRRKPESRFSKAATDLTGLVKLQQNLLTRAIELTKPGGKIAYITCSPLAQETVGVVRTVIEKNNVSLVDLNADKPEVTRKTIQLWSHLNDSDSMFMALLEKQ